MTEGDPRNIDQFDAKLKAARDRIEGRDDQGSKTGSYNDSLGRRRLSDEHRAGGRYLRRTGPRLADRRADGHQAVVHDRSHDRWDWWRRFSTSCGCPRTSSGGSTKISGTDKDPAKGPRQGRGQIVAAEDIRRSSNSQSIRWSPIHIGGLDVSFTNSALWMVDRRSPSITAFMLLGTAPAGDRSRPLAVAVREDVRFRLQPPEGERGQRRAASISRSSSRCSCSSCSATCFGLLPYAFTVTSHIIVTAAMAVFVFVGVTIIGIARHGLHFFSYFVPQGAPMWLMPIMIPIEILSYFIRPMSLSVRLFANMVAGHVMLAVVGGFVVGARHLAGLDPARLRDRRCSAWSC